MPAGSERIIFTITRNDSGDTGNPDDTFTLDLRDQLDHPNASGELRRDPDVHPGILGKGRRQRSGQSPERPGDPARGENDMPRSRRLVSKQVEEDAMSVAAGSDLSTGQLNSGRRRCLRRRAGQISSTKPTSGSRPTAPTSRCRSASTCRSPTARRSKTSAALDDL